MGRTLLNASQKTRAEAPFLLSLAGTPGLQTHLGQMGATFWERSGRMYPNLLSNNDTEKALVEPLKKYGITFEEDCLQAITEDTQGYPYFVQLWGDNFLTRSKSAGKGI